MHVFLTGATGYVGSHVARLLLDADHTVTGLARSARAAEQLAAAGVAPVRGDLTSLDVLGASARAADAVVHTAFVHDFAQYEAAVATDLAAIAAFADALAGSGKPFVTTNGTGFLGDTGLAPVDEAFGGTPGTGFGHARRAADEATLAAAERGVRSAVVRAPLFVYGDGGSAFVPLLLAAARRDGVSRYVGDGEARQSAVHVADLAAVYRPLVEALAAGRVAAGRLYHVAAGEPTRALDLAEAVADNAGVPVASVGADVLAGLDAPTAVSLAALSFTNVVSADRTRRELGWEPEDSPSILYDVRRGSYTSPERTRP